jgi:hypothetical protein
MPQDTMSKRKFLEYLEQELDFHRNEADGEYAYQKWFYITILSDLRDRITLGLFDEENT